MKRFLLLLLAATSLGALPASAQTRARNCLRCRRQSADACPTTSISAKSAASRRIPRAISSSTRAPAIRRCRSAARAAFAHGGSRLFQFDRTGKFVREIGKDSYGFMFAQQVRIDPQDNIWIVDQMTNTVIKFDPEGRVAMILGRKAEAIPVPARGPGAGGVPAVDLRPTRFRAPGLRADLFNRPTDVAFDAGR